VVERLQAEPGEKLVFDQVLMLGGEGKTQLGQPLLEGVQVEAKVVEQSRTRTLLVFRRKRRKNFRRMRGHRQYQTLVEITDIVTEGKASSQKAAAKKTAAKKTAAKKTTAKAEAMAETAAAATPTKAAQKATSRKAAAASSSKSESEAGSKSSAKPKAAAATASKAPAKKAAPKSTGNLTSDETASS
jgi:large subunit ribosomal protein L21